MLSSLATSLSSATLSTQESDALGTSLNSSNPNLISQSKKSSWDPDAVRSRLKKAINAASSMKQKAALESEVAKELARKNEALKVSITNETFFRL